MKPGPATPAGMLPGTALAWAHHLVQRAASLFDPLHQGGWRVDERLLAGHLLLPLVVAAANHLDPPPPAPEPYPAPGGGWVAIDLGPEDAEPLARLLAVIDAETGAGHPPPDAEKLARRAQAWRLAVTPYRNPPKGGDRNPPKGGDGSDPDPHVVTARLDLIDASARRRRMGPCPPAAANPNRPLKGIRVLDLTVLWAGPLATWLLAQLGAEVIKIEPACRPDGLRAGPRPPTAGHGALFGALNHGKSHRTLDLRRPADHARFLALVAEADIVIDNFSPRVRPNLDIDPARLAKLRPGLIDLSLTAFAPRGPQADWVAYGGGVHASSGLGAETLQPSPVPYRPALVSYPDPIAGLTAFVLLLGALQDRSPRPQPGQGRIELSLEGCLQPLLPGDGPGRAAAAAASDSAVAAAVATAASRTVVVDGCRVLPSPLLAAARTGGSGRG